MVAYERDADDRSLRVLVVDDDPEDRALVRDLLADLEELAGSPSIELEEAATYQEGLDALQGGSFDACLLDHRLGARTGLDFLEEPVVAQGHVPVLLLTGMDSREVERRAARVGAVDYLPKSELTPLTLERSLRYAVERARRTRVEARYKALIEHAQDLVSVVGSDGTLLYVSPSLSRMLGFDPEEKAGLEAMSEVHPEDRPRVEARFEELVRGEAATLRLQYRVRHRDGSWRTLDSLATDQLRNPAIRGIVVNSWDITERVRREERIRFQAELLGAVGEAVVGLDRDGSVVYVNPAAERLFGWSEEEARGRFGPSLVTEPGPQRETLEKALLAVLEGDDWSGEVDLRHRDGTSFTALLSGTPHRDDEGRIIGAIASFWDISELVETRRALRERVKEIQTLNSASRIMNRYDLPLAERLRALVELVPGGWLHPEITEARLVLGHRAVETDGFRATPWTLGADIELDGVHGPAGRLEVVLTEEAPGKDAGPFLHEEEDLLRSLAATVARAVTQERAARQHERVVEGLQEAVAIVDYDGEDRVLRDVNRATEDMFGYDRDELVGASPAMLHVSEEAYRRFGREAVRALREGGAYRGDFSFRRKDGEVFEAEQTVSLLRPEEGIEGGAVTIVRDVSERHRAERELRESEALLRLIAENIQEVFWISDPEKDAMEYLSPAFEDIWGRPRKEIYEEPMAWAEAIVPEDRDGVLESVAAQAAGGYEEEYRIRRPDGEVRWIWDRAFPILDEEGEVERIVGVAKDVTERKELEERLRQSQKMEAVGRLAGGIAHDFNNLLTVIRSQTDLVLLDLDEESPLRADIEGIQGAADRAARLTSQLLAFSREQVLRPRVIRVNDVILETGGLLERVIGEPIELVYDLDAHIPPVEVDPGQLEQVLLNLAVNARDAMPEGGELRLSTSLDHVYVHEVDPEAEPDDQPTPGTTAECVVVRVADTGVGMAEDVQERIFEPFFTTKPTGEGTGLGLAMAYGFMKQTGGDIAVHSRPGEGTVFSLRFPPATGEVPEEEKPRDGGAARPLVRDGSGRVLVVEDDADVRRVARRVLERAGLEVEVADSGEAGWGMLQGQDGHFDLLLTDLVLPGTGGQDLARRCRESLPDLAVIVMSGYDASSPGERGDLPPEVGFIQKPFTPDELVDAVGRAMGDGGTG